VNRERLRLPPSQITGELGSYLQDVWKALNAIPSMSMFSGVNPTSSNVTGVAGNIAVNVGSASNTSRLWVKFGSASIPDKASWSTVI
jgi:hypothetical protein